MTDEERSGAMDTLLGLRARREDLLSRLPISERCNWEEKLGPVTPASPRAHCLAGQGISPRCTLVILLSCFARAFGLL